MSKYGLTPIYCISILNWLILSWSNVFLLTSFTGQMERKGPTNIVCSHLFFCGGIVLKLNQTKCTDFDSMGSFKIKIKLNSFKLLRALKLKELILCFGNPCYNLSKDCLSWIDIFKSLKSTKSDTCNSVRRRAALVGKPIAGWHRERVSRRRAQVTPEVERWTRGLVNVQLEEK